MSPRAHTSLVAGLFLAALLVAGCGHIPPDVALRRPARSLEAPPDQAMFVVIQPQNSGLPFVIFTADGTPLCEVPSTLYCVMLLAPGHHRLYATPSAGAGVDALELDVVAGRRYVATVSASWGLRFEELTAASPADRVAALGGWLARQEASLDAAGVERLRADLAAHADLVENADERWRRYDAEHLAVHQITPDESL